MTSSRFRVIGMEDLDDVAAAPKTEKPSQSMNDTTVMSTEDVLENPDDPKAIAHMFDALHSWVDATISDTDSRGEAHHAVDGLTNNGAYRMYALMTRNDIAGRDSFLRTSELDKSDLRTAAIHSDVRWKTPKQ